MLISLILFMVTFISEGVGRSDSDRQYVFVNSRPVDIPRINRVMNEMWRR
jgi:DNA mismatch repair ATPase MutL